MVVLLQKIAMETCKDVTWHLVLRKFNEFWHDVFNLSVSFQFVWLSENKGMKLYAKASSHLETVANIGMYPDALEVWNIL